jgi:hypothetical protein
MRLAIRFVAAVAALGLVAVHSGAPAQAQVITLNGAEPYVRQRFSLMHELKHIIDHTTKHYLYGNIAQDEEAAQRAERAADSGTCQPHPEWQAGGSYPKRAEIRDSPDHGGQAK